MKKETPTVTPIIRIFNIGLAVPLALSLACCSDSVDEGDPAPTEDVSSEYPLTTCVVSGEELGSMGDPIIYDHNGTTVKFCCKSCIPKFEKDPEKYLGTLKQAR